MNIYIVCIPLAGLVPTDITSSFGTIADIYVIVPNVFTARISGSSIMITNADETFLLHITEIIEANITVVNLSVEELSQQLEMLSKTIRDSSQRFYKKIASILFNTNKVLLLKYFMTSVVFINREQSQ